MTNKIFRVFLGLVATAMIASPALAVNLLANPGFEVPPIPGGGPPEYFGAPGWTDFGGTTFTIGSVVFGPAGPHGGVQGMKMFAFGGIFQQFAANAGETWDGSTYMLNDTADLMTNSQVAAINIEWINAGGTNIGTVFGGTISAASASNVWSLQTASGIAPVGTAFARLVLITGDFAGPLGFGGAPRFDDASLGLRAVPVPAAVWLFGSGLGLLGAFRRRSA